jgi:DNA replication protein DnaC
MNPESISSNDERAMRYESPEWRNKFEQHGIESLYHDKWFFNYHPVDNDGQETLNRVIRNSRVNKPIALLGSVGKGKTHLACAILKDALIQGSNIERPKLYKSDDDDKGHISHGKQINAGHYFTMSDLNRHYRESIKDSDKSETAFMELITDMKCLVIDEIQIKSNTDSEQRMFQEILDKRYAKKKQTVLIGNVSVNEFKEILGERLVDRLKEQDAEIIVFKGSSYRERND